MCVRTGGGLEARTYVRMYYSSLTDQGGGRGNMCVRTGGGLNIKVQPVLLQIHLHPPP